ncbi:hypothetical protein [Reichenbachiella ulvae]|uniref:Outer membrane protein beta-barrel family protein n=1 Tax=Reichenbachiella ulvae TaxID=2980104 RepID=A0ABT3D0S8_9BACT|nr:hypothetical protein [Reichenbachiella ulvae]MCV9389507.1 hypothetical protein [Reichenbachiella ulvae]
MTSSTETNLELLGQFNPFELGGGLKVGVTAGANFMAANSYAQTGLGTMVWSCQIFTRSTTLLTKMPLSTSTEEELNSVFGMAQLSFREYLFLDFTARNDWSSTLQPRQQITTSTHL